MPTRGIYCVAPPAFAVGRLALGDPMLVGGLANPAAAKQFLQAAIRQCCLPCDRDSRTRFPIIIEHLIGAGPA